ncbi:hypothetical protein QIS99_13460 [Streptomyces sp. B-S-A8]|uniref:CopG family transcriptional regulator n=1 Tax=Streptomyces solicavernae TaxID=3043614 RepID=A0ABT6RRX3_9ACTN|nr:hypothetical protein [Streptomyces sp. B-S-A8]MDI3387200.1 hypothetical protein [Streptomyces sp. B-S-A8]
MGAKRSMITLAVDTETKERVRAYADAAGVDLTTYVAAAIGAAMERDDQVARAFAPLDELIAETERSTPGAARPAEGADGIADGESEAIGQALDDFFATGPAAGRGQGAA